MADEERMPEGAALPAEPAREPASAGQLLRAAREARGLHIAALAAMLKVPQAKLEMLEADRWRELPDATFARALAKAVCRTLKIDAAPVLELLPREQDRELNVSLGLNTPYRDRGEGSRGFSPSAVAKPVVWAPVLLLVAAGAVYLAPPLHLNEPAAAPAASAAIAPAVDAATTPASDASVAPADAGTPAASGSSGGPGATPVPTLAAATAVASPAAAVPEPTRPAASAAASPPPKPAAASASVALATSQGAASQVVSGDALPLTLKTTAETWVQITDASGQTLVSRLIPAGSEQVFAGTPPLRVTIGNVSGAQLLLRGQALDLAARAQNNVARLEVQ